MSSAIVQNQFIEFHEIIRLELEDHQAVIEKRDMLIEEIKAFLKKKSEDEKKPLIRFDVFMQGSYSMGTGNEPLYEENDYDIDAGLTFYINKNDYGPIEAKKWVFDALDAKQFRTVEWKKACIRVQYIEKGYPKFHVDFAVYSDESSNADKKTYLAKGKPTLSADQNKWEESEPKKLKTLINEKYSDTEEKAQFKREIHYYKRWKDFKFDSVNGKPTGIALTALAYNGFRPMTKNLFTNQPEVDDLKATLEFTKYILTQFHWPNGRIKVKLPVPPYNDLFEKMTDDQCKTFKDRLEKIKTSLQYASEEADPHEACKALQKEFGDQFPVPPKEKTGQSRRAAVAGTTESA